MHRHARRRSVGPVRAVLVGALTLTAVLGTVPVPALAAAPAAVVLAAAAEPVGPEPAPRDAEDNPARDLGGYEDREVPFTWGAAWLLTFLGLSGLAAMLLVYYRGVARSGGARRA